MGSPHTPTPGSEIRRAPVLICLLLLLSGWGCDGEREVVDGFHGYRWGTRVSQIPEVSLEGLSGERDGLLIYSANVTFLGRDALAAFYFDAPSRELVQGMYVLSLTLQECDAEWDRILAALQAEHPTLRTELSVPRRTGEEGSAYDSDCEFFVFNAHRLEWSAELVNPGDPRNRILLTVTDVGRTARLRVLFRSGEAEDARGEG